MSTTFENKCLILADLWMNYREDEEFIEFIEYNDFGLPLAYAIANGIVEDPNSIAQNFIGESFDLLLAGLEIEEDTGFELLDDLFS